MTLNTRFAGAMVNFLPSTPKRLGLAVSGGSDSMALMYLVSNWVADMDIDVEVVSVDHGLRPDAADEAQMVAGVAAQLGLRHSILRWRDWDRQGNLQDAARRARRRLIAEWAKAREIRHICLGHTLDDQAETVLMRLVRGSGVDGLAGMATASEAEWYSDGRS